MKHKFDRKKFSELVKKSQSMGHLLEMLGIVKAGGNYATMKNRIHQWNIDISHWEKGQRERQGYLNTKLNLLKRIPLSEILVEYTTYGSNHLRKRLIKEGIFERKCYKCNNTQWMELPITLELEHINGKKTDCRRENLTLLCPNCHSQTPTWRRTKNGSREGSCTPKDKPS